MVIGQLLTRSCVEINAASAGDTLQPEVAALALDTFNMILDAMNANDRKLVAALYSTFNITPNLQPHTIGPTGATWTYPIARPTKIPAASIILTDGGQPYPYVALTPMTDQQFQSLITPTLASNFPNYYYYRPSYPNGSFYFWTEAQTAYQVQIQTMQQLAGVTAATTFELPQGYYYLLMLLLSKALAAPLRKVWTPDQETTLTRLTGEIFGLNSPELLYATVDAGMPTSGGANGQMQDFIFSTGQLS